MRIILALVFITATALNPVLAQMGTTTPLDEIRPDESSPFFVNQQLARYYNSENGQAKMQENLVAKYPSTGGNDSAPVQMKKFFKEMFGSVRLGPNTGKTMSRLSVEPKQFKVGERGEITVNFQIENTKNHLIVLDFPTTQRIEILLKDSSGNVLEKWSANQTFTDKEGVLMVNPDERVEYSEIIPTRGMKAGETYTIEASLAGNPEFTQTTQVTPN